MSFRNVTKTALRDLIEQAGPVGAVQIIRESIRDKKIRPEDFSFPEIWEACYPGLPVSEAVTSDLFPQITGELINAKVIDGYNAQEAIGDMLVETIPSKLKMETMVGFDAMDTPEEVEEGGEYQGTEFGEKYATITTHKYGRLIEITEEAVFFDRTGQIMSRAMTFGEKARLYKERKIIEGVQDINSTIYKPRGVAQAFYRTSETVVSGYTFRINSKSSTPFGESGIEAFEKLVQKMEDENGDPVMISPTKLLVLVPSELYLRARQLAKSAKTPESNDNAENVYQGSFTPLTSYYITKQSASTWYAGDFRKDFKWLEVWPLQVLTQKTDSDAQFRKDLKAVHKVRFYGDVGAVDSVHSFKFTG